MSPFHQWLECVAQPGDAILRNGLIVTLDSVGETGRNGAGRKWQENSAAGNSLNKVPSYAKNWGRSSRLSTACSRQTD